MKHTNTYLLQPTDIVSVATGLVVVGDDLVDLAVGARHKLTGQARGLVLSLIKPVRFSQWLETWPKVTTNDKLAIIGFLDSIGGLRVQRQWLATLNLRFGGNWRYWPARRFPGKLTGLIASLSYTMSPLVAGTLVIVILGYGANLNMGDLILGQLIFLVSLFCSTCTHELIHLGLTKSKSPSQFVVRGLRLGLLHKPLSRRRELVSAIAGPVSGLVIAEAIALGLLWFDSPSYWIASAAAVGVFHLASWLPDFGDGAVIAQQWRRHASTA